MNEFMDFEEEVPIKVLIAGVGGVGTSAVNCMMEGGMEGVEFLCVDMNKKHLYSCQSSTCMLIGERLTRKSGEDEGPGLGEKAAMASRHEFKNVMEGFDMLFIICGMGGKTGTGAAPVIARIARDMGILTVGIVTKPFYFEGERRKTKSLEGIEKLGRQVDSLIVISNDKLLEGRGECAFKSRVFCMEDVVFREIIQGITDLLIWPALINLAFEDVVTVMKEKGIAYVGSGSGTGEYKIQDAVCGALTNPLVETSIDGASYIILYIAGDIGLYEANEACSNVQEKVGEDAEIIFGARIDRECPDTVNITVVATGMKAKAKFQNELKIASFLQRK